MAINAYTPKIINEYLIRPATMEDQEDFLEVLKQGWLMAHVNVGAGITKEDILAKFKDMNKQRIRYQEKLVHSNLVLVKDGRVIGLAGYKQEEDGTYGGGIYLKPEYKGKGLGRTLFNELLTTLPSIFTFRVEVAEYNKFSQKMFKELGFTPTGEKKVHEVAIGKSFPTIIMEKERNKDIINNK